MDVRERLRELNRELDEVYGDQIDGLIVMCELLGVKYHCSSYPFDITLYFKFSSKLEDLIDLSWEIGDDGKCKFDVFTEYMIEFAERAGVEKEKIQCKINDVSFTILESCEIVKNLMKAI